MTEARPQARDFVGRTAELSELRSTIEDAAEGRGSLVLVAGEPGIGKTRLAEAAVHHARAIGLHVRWATCWEGPTAAFWPWTQLLRAHVDDVGDRDAPPEVLRLAGEVASPDESFEGDAEVVRFGLFDAIGRYWKAEAARRPLVLIFDDLQWADVPSLRLLEFFSQGVRDVPIVVLATYRDVEIDPESDAGRCIEALTTRARVAKLDGLPASDLASLLETTLGSPPPSPLTRTVHERTGGNPLFVRELGRLLAAQGRLDRADVGIPESVRGVIGRRLARLSQPTDELLQVAAVLGLRFRLDVLSRAADREPDAVLRLLEEADRARLIAAVPNAPGSYEFAHTLVREVLYDAIPLRSRRPLHRAAADAIEAAGDVEGQLAALAHHSFEAAAAGGDAARAVDFSARAGRRALDQLAYEDAVSHFRRALAALDLEPDDDVRTALLLELGDACLRSGDLPQAQEAFGRAADIARRRGHPTDLAHAALGFGAGLSGFEVKIADRAQVDLLREALNGLDPGDSAERAWLLARLSVALTIQETVERRRTLAEEAVAVASRIEDPAALAYALSALCDATAGPDDCEARLERSGEIVRLAQENGDRPMELLGRRMRVVAFLEVGNSTGADAEIDEFARLAEAMRQPLYSWYVPLWRGMQALVAGRFDVAEGLAEEARLVGERAHSSNAAMLSNVLHWMSLYQQERYTDAIDVSRVLFALVAGYGLPYADLFSAAGFVLDGRPDEARPFFDRVAPFVRELPLDSEFLPSMCQWSDGVAALGDADLAAWTYDRLLPYRSLFGVEGIGAALHGSVEYHLGILADTLGRAEEAREHLEAAVARNTAIGAPALAARAQRALERIGGRRPARNSFRIEGEYWSLSYDGDTVRLKDAKGLHDIATLLARLGREVAALDLATERGPTTTSRAEGLGPQGHAGEVLDEHARDAYKARVASLEEEIAEAETFGDLARAERAREERDVIARELASAYGLGGRPRRTGDPAERARSAVTQRIREAIKRISDVHPSLGRHLRASIRTGTFCSYAPEVPVTWDL